MASLSKEYKLHLLPALKAVYDNAIHPGYMGDASLLAIASCRSIIASGLGRLMSRKMYIGR